MTENEAISYFRMATDEAGDEEFSDLYKEMCSMAIKALEKQIPKKPLHNGANWYRCPNGCEVHKKTFEKDWYCPKCGQALDWQ